MKANIQWRYTQTCASWASDVVMNVVGEDVDADDTFGFETPHALGASIIKLEKKDPTSKISPKKITKNPAPTKTSTSGR